MASASRSVANAVRPLERARRFFAAFSLGFDMCSAAVADACRVVARVIRAARAGACELWPASAEAGENLHPRARPVAFPASRRLPERARGGHSPGMADQIHYGIDNPHPLFNRKTELVWDGKYDEYGRRREVDIAGCAMPLQKIEMIDEPLSQASADGTLELFAKQSRRLDDARNRLIWGDNKLVMASLLEIGRAHV